MVQGGLTVRRVELFPRCYHDSVRLLRVSEQLQRLPGVVSAAAVMATSMNLELLAGDGYEIGELDAAGPDDMVVALVAADGEAAASALASLDGLLHQKSVAASTESLGPRSLEVALGAGRGAEIVVIAVPGAHAALEAEIGLRRGRHVFLFSDNVRVVDEVRLKRLAISRDLLLMGPDCGTAILGGVGLGFANRVRRGSVGLVGASGTGLQQVSSLIHSLGGGIAAAIGTGGRDLSTEVGGLMTIAAIDRLESEPSVDRIGLVSKPADPAVARLVLERLASCGKPAFYCLLGSSGRVDGVSRAGTLAELAYMMMGIETPPPEPLSSRAAGSQTRRKVLGFFCGGTLCHEAERIVVPARGVDARFLDLGADEFTQGRAHPMIDQRLRASLIAAGGDEADVILFDVVLGDLSHRDPAPALAPAIEQAQNRAARRGVVLTLIASLVGTDLDPQGLRQQRACLEELGVRVTGSNAQAAAWAAFS